MNYARAIKFREVLKPSQPLVDVLDLLLDDNSAKEAPFYVTGYQVIKLAEYREKQVAIARSIRELGKFATQKFHLSTITSAITHGALTQLFFELKKGEQATLNEMARVLEYINGSEDYGSFDHRIYCNVATASLTKNIASKNQAKEKFISAAEYPSNPLFVEEPKIREVHLPKYPFKEREWQVRR